MAVAVEKEKATAAVGKVIELTAESTESFEDAIRSAIKKAGETVDDIKAAWVESQQVKIENGEIVAFRVDLKVTFIVH